VETENMEVQVFADKRYYRVDEIAKALNVSKRTVYRMMNDIENPLRAERIRGGLRVMGCVINKYLEDNRKEPVWE